MTCEGYYSKTGDREGGVHEEMPVAEQSYHYAANTCFCMVLFVSSLSSPEGRDEATCQSVRGASQHTAAG